MSKTVPEQNMYFTNINEDFMSWIDTIKNNIQFLYALYTAYRKYFMQ